MGIRMAVNIIAECCCVALEVAPVLFEPRSASQAQKMKLECVGVDPVDELEDLVFGAAGLTENEIDHQQNACFTHRGWHSPIPQSAIILSKLIEGETINRPT